MALGVSVSDVFNTLQVYLGSYYVNNFNEFGRTWQVNIQADQRFRDHVPDIRQLLSAQQSGTNGPPGHADGSARYQRPRAGDAIQHVLGHGHHGQYGAGSELGRGDRLDAGNRRRRAAASMAFDWTELTFLQLQAGNAAIFVFALAVVFVFLVLAAQYESWELPLAVILVVPMCLLCSIVGVRMGHLDVNIFTQIGFVVLVGLASKNAILIVEFAKQQQDQGDAAARGGSGSQPVAVAADLDDLLRVHPGRCAARDGQGAGAEMRRALGLAVFSGMLGVTVFGLFLTPVFYYVIQAFSWSKPGPAPSHEDPPHADKP